MPGEDRTGPLGQGPRTGRGYGLCGRGVRRSLGRPREFGRGMGLGRGFGRGRGIGRGYEHVEITQEEEKKDLEEDLELLERRKEEIQKRIKEME